MQQSPAIIGISVLVVIDIMAFRDTIDPAMYESAWNCPTTSRHIRIDHLECVLLTLTTHFLDHWQSVQAMLK
eukprot:CCRYP_002973-RA/>CCRYP_002973-RA protein AED:0.00 eAED:0.00 QI:50/1/1/1/0/0/2/124/71